MKERFINVLKWFFIVLGVLFFAQIILFFGMIIYANSFKIFSEPKIKTVKHNFKDMQNVIDYVEKYKTENNKYPDNINNIKQDKNIEYKYSLSDENNCYNIELKYKKKNTVKKYKHCDIKKDNFSSSSESYSETVE